MPRLVLEWRAAEAQGHLHRRAAAAGESRDRPRAHRFNQAVAATGRLSSSDPNLQNIPIRTELGREIRARVRRRARARADLRRLLADRAARARAPVGRRRARRGVPQGHDIHDRTAEGVRREERPRATTSCAGARRSSTTRCSTERPRSRWPRTSACRSRRRRSSSTRYFAGFPSVRAFIDQTLARRARPAS